MLLKRSETFYKKKNDKGLSVLLQHTYLRALSVYLEVLFSPFQVLVFLTVKINNQIDWLNNITLFQ